MNDANQTNTWALSAPESFGVFRVIGEGMVEARQGSFVAPHCQ
jgi:hypothetical protein